MADANENCVTWAKNCESENDRALAEREEVTN